jgi:transcriptional regulator with XRE-family HTH domain
MPDIGEIIRYIREEQRYTRKHLEVCCGVRQQTIGRIENTGLGNIKSVETILSALGYELEVVPINGRD